MNDVYSALEDMEFEDFVDPLQAQLAGILVDIVTCICTLVIVINNCSMNVGYVRAIRDQLAHVAIK